ncbi:MAG: hypothetical protein NWE76_01860 [Candidatus Bathyarchaeota archaeon]|nr:hypothetical protein [Candidatus Bathyarchaeota archaeon]
MSDGQGSATVQKWSRKREQDEHNDKTAREKMKSAISGAMKDPQTHRNLSQELLRARQGGGAQVQHREGYGDDGEIFTGIFEDRPWERD